MHPCIYICISHLHGSSYLTLENGIYKYTCTHACMYVCMYIPSSWVQLRDHWRWDIHICMHPCVYICISHLHGSSYLTLENGIYIYTCTHSCMYVYPIFMGPATWPLKMGYTYIHAPMHVYMYIPSSWVQLLDYWRWDILVHIYMHPCMLYIVVIISKTLFICRNVQIADYALCHLFYCW
jgi:hypothetical protein